LESHIPIYLQISRALKEKIVHGILPEGTKLPSAQALAESLAVARTTVVKAYEDLTSQGYTATVAGGGTYVSSRALEAKNISAAPATTSFDGSSALSHYAKQLETVIKSGEATAVENVKLNYGAPATDMLPLQAWKQVLLNECRNLELLDADWRPEPFGLYRCRAAIADFFCRSKGLKCSPEQIMLFAGCKESFPLVARILLNEGDLVALENPSYEDLRSHMKLMGVDYLAINVDDDGMIVSELKNLSKTPKLVYVSPSQDPTGVMMSSSRRQALLEWSAKNNVTLWEEAWDTDYSYSPPQHAPLQSQDQNQNVIYSYSFWKLLYPLVSIGTLVLPPRLIPYFERARQLADIQFSVLEQKTLGTFISEGLLDRHLKKSKKVYELRRKALLDSLLQEFRGLIEIKKHSSGLHLCVRFAKEISKADLQSAAEEARFPLVSTHAYYLQNPRDNEFLLPFALFSEEAIHDKISRFSQVLREKISVRQS
jgi:GntR family transcriptional regulator/MocR family aminotransferase